MRHSNVLEHSKRCNKHVCDNIRFCLDFAITCAAATEVAPNTKSRHMLCDGDACLTSPVRAEEDWMTGLNYVYKSIANAEQQPWPPPSLPTAQRSMNHIVQRFNGERMNCLACIICSQLRTKCTGYSTVDLGTNPMDNRQGNEETSNRPTRNRFLPQRHMAKVLSVIVHVSEIVNTIPNGTTTRDSVHYLSQHYCSSALTGFPYCTRSPRDQLPQGSAREDLLPARRTLRTKSDLTQCSRASVCYANLARMGSTSHLQQALFLQHVLHHGSHPANTSSIIVHSVLGYEDRQKDSQASMTA